MNSVLASILAIGFWAIAAVALVLFAAWVYVEVQYYHWNKQERESDQLVKELSELIAEKIADAKINIYRLDDNFENEELITTLVSRDVNESVER